MTEEPFLLRQRVEEFERNEAEWNQEDDLSVARGFWNGLLIGAVFWIFVASITLAWIEL